MNEVTLIGIDLGKYSFHLHAQDATGRMVFRKKLSRQQLLRTLANVPSCRVVMEACAGSHWLARQLAGMGHEPRLISPQFVRPFVAGNKNDFGDAQAIQHRAMRKLRDDVSVQHLFLVIAGTHANRAALAATRESMRTDLPLDTRAILHAWGESRCPGAGGIVVL